MLDQAIRIMCPNLTCRKVLSVPVASRGRMVKCRNCGATIRVPEKNAPGSAAPVPAPTPAGENPVKG
ncbi:MAG TPA: hypothetical protein VD963_10460 [Phycisphaerales bacterium]|nr:hypothetical protein [Phycisphaerales bacterium]